MRLRAALAAAGLWLLACAPSSVAAQPAPSRPVEATASSQVLVMLRLAPEHFRPGAGYAGAYGDGAGLAARRRIAERLAHEHGLALVSEWPMPVLGVDCYLMAAPKAASPAALAAALSRDPQVAWSEPMHLYRAEGKPPNDPLFAAQPAAKAWRLADLHEVATGRNVRVAVVDSRIDVTHPDLVGQVKLSRDFVEGRPGEAESHGTAVAAIIAARADNQAGIAGVAPGARLLGLRACWQQPARADTFCDTLGLARAIDFAMQNSAQVINLSLSGPPDLLLGRLLDVAMARGAVVVAASDPALAEGGFPASHPGVIAVASEGGPPPARGVILAPGRDIPTAQSHGRWSLVNGSSFAAAHVTGLVALMREKDARADRASLVLARGGGEIDACATLVRLSGPCGGCACAVTGAPRTSAAH
ncbi:MAG: S8 family peptidase [Phenylobacterium sp.]